MLEPAAAAGSTALPLLLLDEKVDALKILGALHIQYTWNTITELYGVMYSRLAWLLPFPFHLSRETSRC